MVSMQHRPDNGWFNIYENDTYIGHIWQRADNMWFFEDDRGDIPALVLSDVQAILATLNNL